MQCLGHVKTGETRQKTEAPAYHASIYMLWSSTVLTDCVCSVGTFVNGDKLKKGGRRELHPNDSFISIGLSRLKFRVLGKLLHLPKLLTL